MSNELHNFYKKMAIDVGQILDKEGFEKDYTIRDDKKGEKNLIIDLKSPLSGEALAMFNECLRHAVTFFCWDLDLLEKPEFKFVSPTMVTIQKSFNDSDFKR